MGTPNFVLAEAYYIKKGRYVPNDHTPPFDSGKPLAGHAHDGQTIAMTSTTLERHHLGTRVVLEKKFPDDIGGFGAGRGGALLSSLIHSEPPLQPHLPSMYSAVLGFRVRKISSVRPCSS